MAKKQTRRTVSIPGALYDRLAAYCDARDVPRCGWVTDLITRALDDAGVAHHVPKAPRKIGGPRGEPKVIARSVAPSPFPDVDVQVTTSSVGKRTPVSVDGRYGGGFEF